MINSRFKLVSAIVCVLVLAVVSYTASQLGLRMTFLSVIAPISGVLIMVVTFYRGLWPGLLTGVLCVAIAYAASYDPTHHFVLPAQMRLRFFITSIAFPFGAYVLDRLRQRLAEATRLEVEVVRMREHARAMEAEKALLDQAMAEARAAEERYHGLVDHLPVMVGIHANGTFRYVNDAGCRLMRAAGPEDIVGRPMLDIIPPENHDWVLRRQRDAARVTAHHAMTMMALDGTSFLAELYGAPVVWEGEPARQIVVRDMSERQKIDEQAQELEALKRLDALKDEFLGLVSHELRTPLTVIKGAATLLADGKMAVMDASQAELVGMILNHADRLTTLINDVLDLSKIEAGRISLHPHEGDLAQTVRSLVEGLAPVAGEQGIDLRVDLEPARCTFDADRVSQVVVNLLSNAMKFTPRGGRVTVRSRQTDEGSRFEVVDTGVGIPHDRQDRIFSKFFQADAGLNRASGGTGLGLAICKQIILAHGGTIGFESEPGEGTTFWFCLTHEVPVEGAIALGGAAS